MKDQARDLASAGNLLKKHQLLETEMLARQVRVCIALSGGAIPGFLLLSQGTIQSHLCLQPVTILTIQ